MCKHTVIVTHPSSSGGGWKGVLSFFIASSSNIIIVLSALPSIQCDLSDVCTGPDGWSEQIDWEGQ